MFEKIFAREISAWQSAVYEYERGICTKEERKDEEVNTLEPGYRSDKRRNE